MTKLDFRMANSDVLGPSPFILHSPFEFCHSYFFALSFFGFLFFLSFFWLLFPLPICFSLRELVCRSCDTLSECHHTKVIAADNTLRSQLSSSSSGQVVAARGPRAAFKQAAATRLSPVSAG